jgi:hypothetical protein
MMNMFAITAKKILTGFSNAMMFVNVLSVAVRKSLKNTSVLLEAKTRIQIVPRKNLNHRN